MGHTFLSVLLHTPYPRLFMLCSPTPTHCAWCRNKLIVVNGLSIRRRINCMCTYCLGKPGIVFPLNLAAVRSNNRRPRDKVFKDCISSSLMISIICTQQYRQCNHMYRAPTMTTILCTAQDIESQHEPTSK